MGGANGGPMKAGQCYCGAVQYQLDGSLGPLVNCHCRHCRRAHGAAFATTALVRSAELRVTAGQEYVREYPTREKAPDFSASNAGDGSSVGPRQIQGSRCSSSRAWTTSRKAVPRCTSTLSRRRRGTRFSTTCPSTKGFHLRLPACSRGSGAAQYHAFRRSTRSLRRGTVGISWATSPSPRGGARAR